MQSYKTTSMRVDDLGRYILDIETPAEATVGKMFGCMSSCMGAGAALVTLSFLLRGSGLPFTQDFIRTFAVLYATGLLIYCWKNIDCYYVLDPAGGQLLYHFSALLIVAEDPVANVEDVAGIGVSYTSGAVSGNYKYALFICINDGRTIRISDDTHIHDSLNDVGCSLAKILEVPFIQLKSPDNSVVVFRDGELRREKSGLVSSKVKDWGASLGLVIFIVPYIFIPTFVIMILAMTVGTNPGARSGSSSSKYQILVLQEQLDRQKELEERQQQLKLEEAQAEKARIEAIKNRIIHGVGITGLAKIDDDPQTVIEKVGLEPDSHESNNNMVRLVFMQGALTVYFTDNKADVIEFLADKSNLKPVTADGTGAGSSMKEAFGLGDGEGNVSSDEEFSFINSNRTYSVARSNKGLIIESRKEGFQYLFKGEYINEIVIFRQDRDPFSIIRRFRQ